MPVFIVSSLGKKTTRNNSQQNATRNTKLDLSNSDRYIEFVCSPYGRKLRLNREIREAFRAHFQDCFARLLNLLVSEFSSYLTDFCLPTAEAASWEVREIDWEVIDALKEIRLNKSPDWMVNPMYCTWVCSTFFAYSNGCVQYLVCSGSHCRICHQGRDHNPREMLQAYLVGFRQLQAYNC